MTAPAIIRMIPRSMGGVRIPEMRGEVSSFWGVKYSKYTSWYVRLHSTTRRSNVLAVNSSFMV